jgi:uncharacterized phage protein (TIGR02216 family)
MEIGLGVLGLSPLVFWAMTPRELQAALSGRFGPGSGSDQISRYDLDALMRQFPDQKGV